MRKLPKRKPSFKWYLYNTYKYSTVKSKFNNDRFCVSIVKVLTLLYNKKQVNQHDSPAFFDIYYSLLIISSVTSWVDSVSSSNVVL